MDFARQFRAAGLQVCIGGFHVSGCIAMLPEMAGRAENVERQFALDDAAMMHGDGRINEVASERTQPRQNLVLVGSGKPRIADDVGY